MLGKKKNEDKVNGAGASPQEEQSNLPLFFANPQVMRLDKHKEAKLRSDITMEFARHTNSIPLTVADIAEASKYYPIVLTQSDTIIPVAIVGLEKQNYFIDKEGRWLEGFYIPSYVRKYPFVFVEVPDTDKLSLCIDEASLAGEGDRDGIPLYEGEEPSALTKNALEFCGTYQEQHNAIRHLCDILKEKQLLEPQRSDVELANGRKVQLGGFQLVDYTKFKSLPEVDILEWFKNDSLAIIYHLFQSQSNWRRLLDLANKEENTKK